MRPVVARSFKNLFSDTGNQQLSSNASIISNTVPTDIYT